MNTSEVFGQLCGNHTLLITVRDGAGTYALNETDSLHALLENCNKKLGGKYNCLKKPDNESDIFYLFTKHNPGKHEILKVNDKLGLDKSNFNKKVPTMMFFPGWLGNNVSMVYSSSIINVSEAALEKTDNNIIIVDWNTMTEDLALILFRQHVMPIAEHCRNFLEFLIKEGVKPEHIHLIGFSLGVHVIAIVLEHMKDQVGRFTALDPLGIVICEDIIEKDVLKERIGRSLAGFVDVIHTSKFGTSLPSGHVDFYMDGGTEQHNCDPDPYENSICSHQRACIYYADSFYHPYKYEGIQCDTFGRMLKGHCDGQLQVMGYYTPRNIHGIYYVPVGSFILPQKEHKKNFATIHQKGTFLFVAILWFILC